MSSMLGLRLVFVCVSLPIYPPPPPGPHGGSGGPHGAGAPGPSAGGPGPHGGGGGPHGSGDPGPSAGGPGLHGGGCSPLAGGPGPNQCTPTSNNNIISNSSSIGFTFVVLRMFKSFGTLGWIRTYLTLPMASLCAFLFELFYCLLTF